jgi:low temperature requirement protein LtrA
VEAEHDRGDEHQVTPLELFFDLVFVFAITLALCGGAALYLLAHITFLYRATGYLFRRRTIGSVLLLALIPAALATPALTALALVSAVCSLVVAYEAIRYRTARVQVRHPELAA